MREKIFNAIIIIVSLFVLFELFVEREMIYTAIIYALNIWVKNLIPSLFPFFIISDILINYNIINYIPKIIKDKCKLLFDIDDNMLLIFILSMISGFPSNARNTRTMYDKKLITLEEANHILLFSHFSNPVFILTTIAIFFFHNRKIGTILLVTHYLSNVILGVCFRNKILINNQQHIKHISNPSFEIVFISAIKKAIDTTITICGIVTVFLMLASIIVNTFNLNSYNEMLVKGLLEITIGIEALSKLSLGMIYKAVITSIFLAFGGLSVHVQVVSQLTGTEIKYIYFFIGRVYQAIIAGILTYLACLILGI